MSVRTAKVRECIPECGIRHGNHLGRRHPYLGRFAHEQPAQAGQERPPAHVDLPAYDLLKTIGRLTGGHQYQLLRESLGRLQATSIVTNIRVPKGKKQRQFSWIESWTDNVDGETQQSRGMSLTLSDWFYEGILMDGGLLSIDPVYFTITGGRERWMYRVARKHAGGAGEGGFAISLPTLFQKSGAEGEYRRFKFEMLAIVRKNDLPGFDLALEPTGKEPSLRMSRRTTDVPGQGRAPGLPWRPGYERWEQPGGATFATRGEGRGAFQAGSPARKSAALFVSAIFQRTCPAPTWLRLAIREVGLFPAGARRPSPLCPAVRALCFPSRFPWGQGQTRASSEGSMRNCPFTSLPAESLPCLIALKIVERCLPAHSAASVRLISGMFHLFTWRHRGNIYPKISGAYQ
jgi:Replication initiator protein A